MLLFSQMCGDFWRLSIYQGSEMIGLLLYTKNCLFLRGLWLKPNWAALTLSYERIAVVPKEAGNGGITPNQIRIRQRWISFIHFIKWVNECWKIAFMFGIYNQYYFYSLTKSSKVLIEILNQPPVTQYHACSQWSHSHSVALLTLKIWACAADVPRCLSAEKTSGKINHVLQSDCSMKMALWKLHQPFLCHFVHA